MQRPDWFGAMFASSAFLCCLLHVLLFFPSTHAALYVVDLISAASSSISIPEEVTVRVCAGLFNRDGTGDSVYLLENANDEAWFQDITGTQPSPTTTPAAFINTCLAAPVVQGYIRYSYADQQLILPNIITIAAVLDAIPLQDDQILPAGTTLNMVLDAVTEMKDFSALQATQYVFDLYGQSTTAMSKMNPGLKAPEWAPTKPTLSDKPDLGLTDHIVKERLFNFFLWFGCIDGSQEEEFLSFMVAPENNPWPEPIPVWGYDTSWLVFGYLWEANTHCSDHYNMGSIPTQNVNNLSYFSQTPAITTPLATVESLEIIYDPNKVYIAFVVGDGDNIAFVKETRRAWMLERVQYCADNPQLCFPLLWTLSPHLLYTAPDIMEWYYTQAQTTGYDSFVLPPSGHLYAYPTKMPSDVEQTFVDLTQEDATLMNTNGIVSWELTTTWWLAFQTYFPRYNAKALFAMNVPYNVPILSFPFKDTYEIVGNNVVFAPNSWRGTDQREANAFFASVDEKARCVVCRSNYCMDLIDSHLRMSYYILPMLTIVLH